MITNTFIIFLKQREFQLNMWFTVSMLLAELQRVALGYWFGDGWRAGGRQQLGFRTITRKVFTWFIWYFGILLHITRERTLLIFGHIRPRSRSQWLKNSAKIWKHEDILNKSCLISWDLQIRPRASFKNVTCNSAIASLMPSDFLIFCFVSVPYSTECNYTRVRMQVLSPVCLLCFV